MDNEKIYSSKKELLKFLGIKDNFLYKDFSTKYFELEKPKKSGGVRLIKPPSPNLKKVQRKILDKILYLHPQRPCVYGLSKNKGILNNAKTHQKNALLQLQVLDIENFFPNISQTKVNNVFKKIGFNKENSSILTKLCTIEKSLPQGAPTSPYLASMVCSKLDKRIYIYCKRRNLTYTRYFDDISISGEKILPKNVVDIEKIISNSGFNCNNAKREFFDVGKDKIINSVLISKFNLSVTDKYKKEIETVHKRMIADNTIENQRAFSGKFGFYLHINKNEALLFLEKLNMN